MLFFARHHVTRAHGATVESAAFADTDAALGRTDEISIVVGKFEMRYHWKRSVVGAKPKVLIQSIRLDDLAWIHFPVGIPNLLELTKRGDELGTIKLGQKL